jgi:hypothetical protein
MAQFTVPAFVNKRFPSEINFGFSGGPVFFTQISSTSGGQEQRQQNWEQARHRYNASHEVKTREELEELLNFFMAVRGMAVGFRFVDWNDWASDVDANQGTVWPGLADAADMAHQDMVSVDTGALGLGDGATVDFQLTKKYELEPIVGDTDGADSVTFTNSTGKITRTVGSWTSDGFVEGDYVYAAGSLSNLNDGSLGVITAVSTLELTVAGTLTDELTPRLAVRIFSQDNDVAPYYRTITKPATVRVVVDGDAWTEGPSGADTFTVDYDTGIITCNTAPGLSDTVQADFVYDVPVRFEKDDWMQQLQHFNVGDVTDISLIELRT